MLGFDFGKSSIWSTPAHRELDDVMQFSLNISPTASLETDFLHVSHQRPRRPTLVL